MNLNKFEQAVEPIILERGKNYHQKKKVKHIEDLGAGEYTLEVHGSELYKVYVAISPTLDINTSRCSCPYDFGAICKHQVAAFYALRNLGGGNTPLVQDLKQLLEQQSKESLIAYLLDFARDVEGIREHLLFELAPQDDELETSRQLIRSTMDCFTSGDFIAWKYVDDALQGTHLILQKIEDKLERFELQVALSLVKLVLEEVMNMLTYTDDSSGYVRSAIDEAIQYANEISSLAADFSTEKDKEFIFQQLLNLAEHPDFEGWSDWQSELLFAAVQLCDTTGRKQYYETYLISLGQQAAKKDSWGKDYEIKRIQQLRLAFLEQTGDDSAAEVYMLEHIDNDRFRRQLIEQAIEKQDFEKVLTLLPEDQSDRKQWKEDELNAYEGLGDIEQQRKIIRQFIIEGKRDYYARYKQLYDVEQWTAVKEKLINELAAQKYVSIAYIDIIIVEQLWKQLLVVCEKNHASIEEYYPYLKEDYAEDAQKIYEEFLLKEAASTSQRSHYRSVCNKIKKFKVACGQDAGLQLIAQLQSTYKKRPAFLDELSQIR